MRVPAANVCGFVSRCPQYYERELRRRLRPSVGVDVLCVVSGSSPAVPVQWCVLGVIITGVGSADLTTCSGSGI